MERKTTFSIKNMMDRNSAVALWAFGFFEGIIAIVQSAEWVQEYIWWPRILPLLAFALAQFKLLFKTETVGGVEVGRIVAEQGADVQVVSTPHDQEPEPGKNG